MGSKNKNNNYKIRILKLLEETPFGLTIKEISDETGFHRNTVSKYVEILEGTDLIAKKQISAAKVFFSKKRKYLRRKLVSSFIQALLHALKIEFPEKEKKFKEVGRKVLKYFQFPIGNAYIKEFEKYRGISDNQAHLKLLKNFYNAFDFFQEDLDISIVELQKNKIVYRFKNSEYLETSDDFIYFYYIACGIIEGIYLQNLNINVKCNVENIHISNNKEESFIDISLEIKD